MRQTDRSGLLRRRDGHHARVTYEELFFDLVYVFAVTQLSHLLLHHLDPAGVVEALILWFAVWLGWQYTCWFTNWFDPQHPRNRAVLFATMLLALVMAASIDGAFGERGLAFALAYVAIQVGRSVYVVLAVGRGHPILPNYRRILGWMLISACFWIAGAFAGPEARAALWIVAVLCEYVSPMFGFALPVLGRSRTSDWTIEGAHLTERCQLFVIVALGETLLATGAVLAAAETWDRSVISVLVATFAGTLAMWWLYFGTSSEDATAKITRSADPGRIGASYHYVHAVLVAGIIATAVGNDLVMAHPHEHATRAAALAISVGPMIYLLGSAIYKRVVYGSIPVSHVIGVLALAVLVPVSLRSDLHTAGWLGSAILLAVGLWEGRSSRATGTLDQEL